MNPRAIETAAAAAWLQANLCLDTQPRQYLSAMQLCDVQSVNCTDQTNRQRNLVSRIYDVQHICCCCAASWAERRQRALLESLGFEETPEPRLSPEEAAAAAAAAVKQAKPQTLDLSCIRPTL